MSKEKPSKRDLGRLLRRREQGEICPEFWRDSNHSDNQHLCHFCKGIDWKKTCEERGWFFRDWGARDWGDPISLRDHVKDWHQCLWCGIRFSDRNRKEFHLANFHGYRWGFPEGIPIADDYVLSLPGWTPPKTVPKTVEEFYYAIQPLLQLHIPGSGAKIYANEPDIDPIKEWCPPKDPPETPSSTLDRRGWLAPLCVRMIEANWPEDIMENVPSDLESQSCYAELHWERVSDFLSLQRYRRQRIADPKRRAELLSVALADDKHSAAYAIQQYEAEHAIRRKKSQRRPTEYS
jgi:hypothetical protein